MADTQDGPELHPVTRELAEGPDHAAISTLLPSGRIQTQYIWVGTDGDRLYVNTETARREFTNMERDARVTLAIRDERDPYRYAEVRGRVVDTTTAPPARAQIDELSQQYDGRPYPAENIKTERVTVRIEPERQTTTG
ncbi:TIGR03618 family F420-dependent PPOX class oxidoreductase [Geodermatophilus sp. SYSU D01119]